MNRDDVNEDMMVMVRQMETLCRTPIGFYFFLKNKVWKEYEHHLADIMEHIYTVTADFRTDNLSAIS